MFDGIDRKLKPHVPDDVQAAARAKSQPAQLLLYVEAGDKTVARIVLQTPSDSRGAYVPADNQAVHCRVRYHVLRTCM